MDQPGDFRGKTLPAEQSLVGRYYDPATGQFLSVDPLVDETGQPYAYTGDDPVNGVDPSGLADCGWNPACYVGSGVDKVNNALGSAVNWASQKTNAAYCANFGPGGVSIRGWLAAQAGCGPSNNASTCLSTAGASTVWNTEGLPPLSPLHPRSTIEGDPSFTYWTNQSTDAIVRSLSPGANEPLLAKPNGTVMDGNTRITVLQDRGYDVDALPRDILGPEIPSIGDDLFGGE